MKRTMRKIDARLQQGLHEVANAGDKRGSFRFQLAFAEGQTCDVLKNLDSLVKNTIRKAPSRKKDFRLERTTDTALTHEEVKWERAMYTKWKPESSEEFVSACKHILTYQYPLQYTRKDRCWGKIDLLGIGAGFLPVPIELKKRTTNESPLRMLVEVAAYGIAIRKVWPNQRLLDKGCVSVCKRARALP